MRDNEPTEKDVAVALACADGSGGNATMCILGKCGCPFVLAAAYRAKCAELKPISPEYMAFKIDELGAQYRQRAEKAEALAASQAKRIEVLEKAIQEMGEACMIESNASPSFLGKMMDMASEALLPTQALKDKND